MARMSLPPGFRFKPTDVELVKYYLKRKVMGKKLRFDAVSELNIYKYSPWDLPDKSCLRSKDLEWYFFCPKERKYASGARTNRATPSGYWKSTGKDRPVSYNDESVGMVKTLVFHTGHPPKGDRTDWVMYEYRIQDKELADAGVVQDAYVLCKVFQKSGPGPKNGAQYGAPFNEEDWDDDEEVCAESLPSNSLPPPALYYDRNDSVVTSMFVPGSTCSGPLSEPGPSNVLPSADEVPPTVQVNDEDMISLFDGFTEDGSLLPDYNGNNEVESFSHWNNSEGLPCVDGNEIYNSLGDLDNWAELSGGEFNFSSHQTTEYGVNPVLAGDDVAFLELNDLNHPLSCSAEATGSEYFHTDSLCEPCYNNYLEQSYILANSFGAVQHVSAMNQLPVLPEGSNGHGDRFDVSQENVVRGTSSLGFAATCKENFPPSELPEEGTRHAVQDQKRGEQQRKSYSRLQQLLESIPAHPASAAEHLAPANRAEEFKETSLFTAYCGSSIHVKAEVTCRCGRWCTEDALSEKLGESAYGCCGCNLPGIGFGEKVVNFGCGFAFFFLGMISALIWIFLVGLLPNFAGMLGILLFFNTFCSSVLCHNCWVRYLSSVNRCYSRLLSLADLVLTEIPWLG